MNNVQNPLRKKHKIYSSKVYMSTKKISKVYEYFSIKIPLNYIKNILRAIKDERFLFFVTYGILRRYEGECDIIYVEIPQIPKKIVIYRKPDYRYKFLYKLNLNNKDLPHIPLFEGEENLKFLSMEQNYISKIDKLVSLNNLIYLNLYGNQITDIENLSCNTKLKILLLGKNYIEKIKNLNILTDLEILDLHSNKIKVIENIDCLKKLRILNFANNQISSIKELELNKKLEELNIRKNLIEKIPNMNEFPPLKRLNIEKNKISKIEYLLELTKLTSLQEIILDYNPVLNNPQVDHVLKRLPLTDNQHNISKNKLISRESQKNWLYESFSMNNPLIHRNESMNLNKSSSIILPNKSENKQLFENKLKNKSSRRDYSNNKISFTREFIYVRNKEHDIRIKDLKENSITQKIDNISNNIKNLNNFYEKNNEKIDDIKYIWDNEMDTIINKGFNGYTLQKFRLIDFDHGHVEIESLNCMKLYGNCLKILKDQKFYKTINTLKFEYFFYDFIMSKKILNYIQKFTKLKCLTFNNNNIYSFYQLIKLENIENLENLIIEDNEICCSKLLIYFVVYRLSNLKFFNHKEINVTHIQLSKDIFEYFDKIISIKEKELELLKKEENNNHEDRKNNSIKEKSGFSNNEKKMKEYDNFWNDTELQNSFFHYASFNLSVAIEGIIIDENNEDS